MRFHWFFWWVPFIAPHFLGGDQFGYPLPFLPRWCPLMSCHTAMLTFQNLQAVQHEKKGNTSPEMKFFPNCDPAQQFLDDIYIKIDITALWRVFFVQRQSYDISLDTSELWAKLDFDTLCNLWIQVSLHPVIHHFFHHPWKFIVLGTTPYQHFPFRKT